MRVIARRFEVDYDGIEFAIRDEIEGKEQHIGDVYVTRSGLTWCRGRQNKRNGIEITWASLIKILERKEL
jgi:hypothetical protein